MASTFFASSIHTDAVCVAMFHAISGLGYTKAYLTDNKKFKANVLRTLQKSILPGADLVIRKEQDKLAVCKSGVMDGRLRWMDGRNLRVKTGPSKA